MCGLQNLQKKEGNKMIWKKILKAHCNTEKAGSGCSCSVCEEKMEKKLVGGQRKLDRDKDGKITGKDFSMLRDSANKADPTETIVSTLEEEGGASGLEPLEESTKMSKDELKDMLENMENVVQHKKGDYILLDGLPLPTDEEE